MADDESQNLELRHADEYVIIPPDGGWGWVVVAAAFYCNCVIDGITFTFGIYLPNVVDTYKTSEASVALIGSCMFGMHLAAGPLAATLTKSFGFRPTVIIGSILTAASLSCSIFHPPLWALTLTLGFFTGTGMCLVYMNCLTITSLYFCKYRLAAMGLVVSGTGFGTAIFALLGNYMLETMTWQQVQLVLAACALLMGVAGLAFRPLEPIRVLPQPPLMEPTPDHAQVSLWDEEDDEDRPKVILRRLSEVSAHSVLSAIEALSHEIYDYQITRDEISRWCSGCTLCVRPGTSRYEEFIDEIAVERLISADDRVVDLETSGRWNETVIPKEKPSRWQLIKDGFKLDWGLLKDIHFLFFCLSGGLCCTAIIMVYTFEKVRIMELGLSKDMGTYFLATLGMANMAWRLFLGFISNKPHVGYHGINVACHVIGGSCVILSIFVNNTIFYILICIACGCAVAAFAVFRPILVVDLVGLEKIADGSGISLLFTGALSIIGPPLGGYLYDTYGSYDYAYYLAGLLFIITGIMLWITSCALTKRQLQPINNF